MTIHHREKEEFISWVYAAPSVFTESIHKGDAYIVHSWLSANSIEELRSRMFRWGRESMPSWHPCLDGCPDYRRVHDNYEKAYVKSKMHAFYLHGYREENDEAFSLVKDIFFLKNFLSGKEPNAYLKNKPSDGQIARILIHHYPQGGGYQAEHIDPVSPYARIQTIIQASKAGQDYIHGGLFARRHLAEEKTYIDGLTQPGDLIIMSPDLYHGVDPIDETATYSLDENTGRWIVMPLIVASDYSAAPRPHQI